MEVDIRARLILRRIYFSIIITRNNVTLICSDMTSVDEWGTNDTGVHIKWKTTEVDHQGSSDTGGASGGVCK